MTTAETIFAKWSKKSLVALIVTAMVIVPNIITTVVPFVYRYKANNELIKDTHRDVLVIKQQLSSITQTLKALPDSIDKNADIKDVELKKEIIRQVSAKMKLIIEANKENVSVIKNVIEDWANESSREKVNKQLNIGVRPL